jgi:hypothetical protein
MLIPEGSRRDAAVQLAGTAGLHLKAIVAFFPEPGLRPKRPRMIASTRDPAGFPNCESPDPRPSRDTYSITLPGAFEREVAVAETPSRRLTPLSISCLCNNASDISAMATTEGTLLPNKIGSILPTRNLGCGQDSSAGIHRFEDSTDTSVWYVISAGSNEPAYSDGNARSV